MAGRVEGKVAFVTGAARGQGRSHALRLAEEGADIIAVDVCGPIPNLQYPHATPEDLEETVRQVEALDRRIVARQADVRDAAAMKAAVDEGVAELGHLDIVVGNAGICIVAPWDEVTEEVWDDTIDTNLKGVWNTVRLTAPHLIAAGGGSIILTSSAAGLKGLPFITPYVASKFGVTGLTKAFAHELAMHNIRVNSLHPTGVATDMGQMGAEYPRMLEANPRLAGMLTNSLPVEVTEPRDQSNAVLFLASDESRYVTAMAMTVDAGNTQY
ncbi:mycofactocin-coupled SDR family oxidoreductase [Agromyces mangrovi Wang et al. 2018]|uniref:mycofactocin-coupled SDR family oxidoreductase n=1 Tax=Agromyces mangrovi TaxID=1858653 RepID=UPI002573E4E0|nr:mycofactocin-coupled SDR family oxidoreductase [Agromyces mangrovi]BDZ64221.1 putative short-chain type dehydrogenase/reductase [Agromyces mangrovi]